MGSSNSTISVIVTRQITFRLLECVLSLLSWVVLPFRWFTRSWRRAVIRQSLQRSLLLSSCLVRDFASFRRFDLWSYRLDNAHVTQSRLILLDATLVFFMTLTIYAYIRFRKLRYRYEFNMSLTIIFKFTLNVLSASFRLNGGRGLYWLAPLWHVLGAQRSTAFWPFLRLVLLLWLTCGTY